MTLEWVLNVNDNPATLAYLKEARPQLYYNRFEGVVRTKGSPFDCMDLLRKFCRV